MKRAFLSLNTPYGTIRVLTVQEYLKFLAEGFMKEEYARNSAVCYIRVIKNHSIEWFARQLGTCRD